MKYFIESTPQGYKFGWETPSTVASFEEKGGHGPLERFYAETERFFHELRKNGPGSTVREEIVP